MEKPNAEPDGLTVLMMSHFLGHNITLISGKAEEWKAEDIADDIVLVYFGDKQFAPTDVGTYHFFSVPFCCSLKGCGCNIKHNLQMVLQGFFILYTWKLNNVNALTFN